MLAVMRHTRLRFQLLRLARLLTTIVCVPAIVCAVQHGAAQDTPLLSGGVGFFTSTNGGSTSYQPHIEPLIAAPLGKSLLVESRSILLEEFSPNGNGQPGYNHSHFADLIYLQGDFLASAHLTVVGGSFLLPSNTYNDRLSEIWIETLQDSPLIAGLGTMSSGLALVPVALVLAIFFFLAKNSPTISAPRPWSKYAQLLALGDTWRLCFLYSLTFGGFLGLASFLTVFFHDQYHLTKVQAGDYTTLVVLSGSFLRPVGGWLSDKIGGYRLLLGLFAGVAGSLMILSNLPPLSVAIPILFLSMGMLGMGNGAVFQIAPQRFLSEIELITGIVGAAGGLGGFFLPSALGALKDISGSYGTGLLCFSILVCTSILLFLEFGVTWQNSWTPAALSRTKVFSYRGSPIASLPGTPIARDIESAAE